ncbi:MAG: hypothetical protein ABRQ38_10800 [Candidatus Eremiobacterota bacterium]
MKKMTEKKGIVIISILMVTVVLLIMTTSMLIIHSSTVGFITTFEKQTMARKLAESGVAYALYSLKNDSQWGDPNDPNCHHITVSVPEVNGKFEIAFNRSASFYSFNNTMNGADPNGGYNNSGVPGYSVDLIVTGTVDKVSKKYRVILQADSYYDGAVTSGAFIADANSITVKTEGDDPNVYLPGSIHSNSVLGVIDPNTGNPITKIINGINHSYAIDPEGSTKFDLYGGVLSAQGDINPSVTLTDPNSQIESNSRARHMKPVDITGIISDAKASTTIQKESDLGNTTYVVGKDSLVNPLDANSSVTIPGVDSDAYSVSNGQLTIKKDIVFSGNTQFEFAYDKIAEGETDTDAQKSIVKNAGIYMEKDPNTGNVPSVYVDGGDLTVAGGAVKGNGSFYVDGTANYIGENNLTASDDPGVAVLANKDVNLSIPAIPGDALNVNMKGLVYSSGDANIARFDAGDTSNVTNFTNTTLSDAGKWPSSWTWSYEEIFESSGGGGASEWTPINLSGSGGSGVTGTLCGADGKYYKYVIEGDAENSSIELTKPVSKFTSDAVLTVGSNGTANVILYNRDANAPASDPNSWNAVNTINLASGQTLTFSNTSPPGAPSGMAPAFRQGICNYTITRPQFDPVTAVYQIPVSTNSPGFNFTGALVAIDPNNPVPSVDKPDDPNTGNININIGSDSNLNITCSSRYLKLLRVIKAGTVFRVVSWTEI